MATALRAAHDGLNVIVAEKSPHFGGTTALPTGRAWVPGNPKGTAATGDTRAEAETYLKALSVDYYNAEGVAGFLDTVQSPGTRPREPVRRQPAGPVAPKPAATGPHRQYRWSPKAISSGLQALKYLRRGYILSKCGNWAAFAKK